MARKYRLDVKDGKDAVKVAVYSALAAGVVAIIGVLANADIPEQWLFIVPIANVLLVSAKDFFQNRVAEIDQ